jgi:hypothetical protein
MMGSGDGHYCEFLKNAEAGNKVGHAPPPLPETRPFRRGP